MKKLEGQVAAVTGSGRGIGRSLALQLAEAGAAVVVNDLDREPAEAVVKEILSAGGRAVACVGSVTDADFAKRFIGTALSSYGDLHIIVNNAGYTWDSVIQKMTDEQFDTMIDLHLRAPWRILREAAAHFRERSKIEADEGREVIRKVVNISSLTATRGNAAQSNYAAAKAGLIGLTRTMAKEWGRYKVAVNCVAFGLIETRLTIPTTKAEFIKVDGRDIPVGIPAHSVEAVRPMIPIGRPGRPEEAAGAVFLFCLPEANYISGQLLEATGGY